MTFIKIINEFISWLWFRSQGLITRFLVGQIILFCLESFIMEYFGINIIQRYTGLNIAMTGLIDIWFAYFVFNSALIRTAEVKGEPLTILIYKKAKQWLSLF